LNYKQSANLIKVVPKYTRHRLKTTQRRRRRRRQGDGKIEEGEEVYRL